MDKVKLTVRLPQPLKDDVERVAGRLGISINAAVVLALGEYVARQDKKKLKEGGPVG
jgi:hypothetical protein